MSLGRERERHSQTQEYSLIIKITIFKRAITCIQGEGEGERNSKFTEFELRPCGLKESGRDQMQLAALGSRYHLSQGCKPQSVVRSRCDNRS